MSRGQGREQMYKEWYSNWYPATYKLDDETLGRMTYELSPLTIRVGAEMLTSSGNDITCPHLVTIYPSKDAMKGTDEFLSFIIARNEGIHTQLWRGVRNKKEGKRKLLIRSTKQYAGVLG